jgi:hypothetical protein
VGPEKGRISKAECTVTGDVSWALKRPVFLKLGASDKCRRNSGLWLPAILSNSDVKSNFCCVTVVSVDCCC